VGISVLLALPAAPKTLNECPFHLTVVIGFPADPI
jgi:hypothetical protein